MRWFVEVSPIDGSDASNKYCVEAKQWQAALQEARRIRGESGPLSKFSIELMDDGYRAVDPAAQLRYVVNKAPANTALSEKGSLRPPTTGRSSVAPPRESAQPASPPATETAPSPAPDPPQTQDQAAPPTEAAAPPAPAAPEPPPAPRPVSMPAARPLPGTAKPAEKTRPPAKPATHAPRPESSAAARSDTAAAIQPMAVHVVGDASAPAVSAAPVPVAAPVNVPVPAPVPVPVPVPVPAPVAVAPAPAPVAAAPAAAAPVEVVAPPRPDSPVSAPPRPGVSQGPKRPPRPSARNGASVPGESIPATEPMPAPGSVSPRVAILVPDDAVPPPAVPSPLSDTQKAPVPFDGARPTQPSMESVLVPDFTLVRKREEEPRPGAPITYREYAYAVDPGTDRRAAEILLWQRFRELSAQIAGRPKGKFIQLAVFDHVFEKRPLRAPIATLAWKDWRGEPVVQFTDPDAPVPASTAPEVPVSYVPSHPVPVPVPVPMSVPVPMNVPEPVPDPPPVPAATSQSVILEVGPEVEIQSSDFRSEHPIVGSEPAVPASEEAVPIPLITPAPPAPPPAPAPAETEAPTAPAPPSERRILRSDPLVRRRRLGEDLISQLFESMHELHFMRDIVSGAEFVLGVLNDTLPCELTLIHVFDINTGQFVLVRANGPGSDKLVLYRTPGQDPLFSQAMRRLHAIKVDDARTDDRFSGGRWGVIGLKPRHALCGGVKQGGRYLGAIELINPGGEESFYESEANALDYICEQFAEFLTNRPIVLDAEVVLSKG